MQRTTNLFSVCAALLLSVACLTGCGGDSSMATIEGKVTLDGAPLDNGAISFVPADGETASAGVRIENGAYKATVPIGAKRIEITATKVVGQRAAYAGQADSPQMDITKSIVPDRYNTKSELTLEVKPGVNDGSFDLKSK